MVSFKFDVILRRYGKIGAVAAWLFVVLSAESASSATFLQNTGDMQNVISSVQFPRPTTVGNTIICAIAASSSTPPGVTDDGAPSNSYTVASSGTGTFGTVFIYYSVTTKSATVITAGAANFQFSCYEFSGISGLDTAGSVGGEYAGSSASLGPYNLASPGELVITKTLSGGLTSTPSGYLPLDVVGGDSAYMTTASTQTFTGVVTASGAPNDIAMATFKSTCSSPTGVAGQIKYNSGSSILQYCDGTAWQDMTGSGTVGALCSSISAPAGYFNYAASIYQFCNGTNLLSMKGPSLATCSGTSAGTLRFDYVRGKTMFCDGTTWYDTTKTPTGIQIQQYSPEIFNQGSFAVTTGFQRNVTAGNTIIVGVSIWTSAADSSLAAANITDTASNTYTAACLQSAKAINGFYLSTGIFYAKNISTGSGPISITFNPPGTVNENALQAIEVSGLSTSAPLDKTASSLVTASVTSGTSGTTATTTSANEIAVSTISVGFGVGGTYMIANSSSYSPTAQDATGNSGPSWWMGYKILSSTGAQSTSWTWTTTQGYDACIATFK